MDTMKSRLAAAIALVFLFMVFNVPAHAQFTSGLTGTVTDQTGAAIAGAKVVVTSQDTHLSRETISAENGDFRITSLPGALLVRRESGDAEGLVREIGRHLAIAVSEADTAEIVAELHGLGLDCTPSSAEKNATPSTSLVWP